MSQSEKDPQRLPVVRKIGDQLRELEAESRRRTRRRIVLGSSSGIAIAIVCVLLVLPGSHTAQALDVVNKAPAAAEGSGSVRFYSALTVTVGGRTRPGISEHGAIDFDTGAYLSAAHVAETGQVIERRAVAGVSYSAEHPGGRQATHWSARRLGGGLHGAFASEADALIEPPAVFRALAGIRAPIRRLGNDRRRGIPTTHYRLATNLDAFLGSSAGYIENRQAYRDVSTRLDVWLDARGRPVEVSETIAGSAPAGYTTITTLVQFRDYGAPVTVGAPSRSLVRYNHALGAANPLGTLSGPILARRLFFEPAATHGTSQP
jgi:hypothetical protein